MSMGAVKMEQKPKNVSPFSNESRNAYVVEHLTSSMLELLKEKPINEISISELCGMAGVGRTSFYRNYKEKEDIIKAYVEHLHFVKRERIGLSSQRHHFEFMRL